MEWSDYQETIFDHVENGSGHGLVNARAGAGKTTTVVEAAHRLPSGTDALFLAFNKHIEEELTDELEGTPMMAKTVHSCAYGPLADRLGSLDVSTWKYFDLLDAFIERNYDLDDDEAKTVRSRMSKLVSMARLTLTDPSDIDALLDVCAHYGIIAGEWIYDIESIIELGNAHARTTGEIDFDDMVYLPVKWDLPFYKNDYVFIDEAQDLNAVQRRVVEKSLKPGGRTLWVGDPRQSIYGFAGADPRSFMKIRREWDVEELSLSICYRSPESHLEIAQDIVPDIEPRPDAPEGTVLEADIGEHLPEIVRDGDYVLCRTNAPLVKQCIRLIEHKQKATVLGRDVATKLTDILTEIEEEAGGEIDYDRLGHHLTTYKQEKLDYLRDKDAPESAMVAVRDRVRCLRNCYAGFEGCESVDTLRGEIDDLFGDEVGEGVTFMTVHKAKGDENDRIHILRPDLLPLAWDGQKEWELKQEMNLRYVALTRSTDTLTFLREGGPGEILDITGESAEPVETAEPTPEPVAA